MATTDPFGPGASPEEEKDPRKRTQPARGAQDPLFYEGKTPVLGEDVSIQEPAAELTFPQASPAAPPMQGPPPTAPIAPNFPAWPDFGDLTPPEFNFEYNAESPTLPTAPSVQLPQEPPIPWWQTALEVGDEAYNLYSKGKDIFANALGQGATSYDMGDYGQPGMNLATGGLAPEELQQAPVDLALGTGGVEPGDLQQAVPAESLGLVGPALSALGAGLGAYGAYTAEPGSRQQLSSGIGALSGAAGLTGALMGGAVGGAGLAGGLATMGPVGAAMTLPFVTGALYEKYSPYYNRDKIQTPPGWTYAGGGNNSGVGGYLVEPNTGRVVQYEGKGKYTPYGLLTPEQAKQYRIETTGEVAQRPEFAAVNTALRNEDIAAAGTQAVSGSGVPTMAHQRSYLEEWRQPYIDRLKAQYPNVGEGELWRLYTLTPEYQQELGMQLGWNQGGNTRYGEGR
jgi:hypothetical protein